MSQTLIPDSVMVQHGIDHFKNDDVRFNSSSHAKN